MIASGTIAALAHAFTRYLREIIPLSDEAAAVVSIVMIAAVTAVNVWGTRKSSDLQNWTTLVKAGLVVLLSAILLSLGHHAPDLPPSLGATQQGFDLFSNFGLAMILVLWAYEGWQFGTYSAGEVVDPQKSFPRAFLLGSLMLIVLYLVANVAYLVALGPAVAANSSAIAARCYDGGSAVGQEPIAATILISTFSATNSVILTAPRVFYAMANDRLFFQKFTEVHPRFKTPAIAIIALGVWSAILASAGKFAELAGAAIFIGWIFLWVRRGRYFPDPPRLERRTDPVSRSRVSVDAHHLCAGCCSDRWKFHLCGHSQSRRLPISRCRHGAISSRSARILSMAAWESRRSEELNGRESAADCQRGRGCVANGGDTGIQLPPCMYLYQDICQH